MKKSKAIVLALLVLLVVIGATGCNFNYKQLVQKTNTAEQPLIRVQIQFSDQKEAICYVRSLGIDEKAQVYTGGSSLNYMYDRDGKILGSFNYSHVIYMKILPDE